MSAARIVPAYDELEAGHASLGLGAEFTPFEQLAFERGEEALAHGVVVGIADGPNRRADAGILAAQTECHGCVLRPLIAMMDEVLQSPLGDGQVHGVDHELRLQIVAHRPPHDATRLGIPTGGQVASHDRPTPHDFRLSVNWRRDARSRFSPRYEGLRPLLLPQCFHGCCKRKRRPGGRRLSV